MIDVNTLPIPTVLQDLDYESLLKSNYEEFKKLVPSWIPYESDEFSIILQAFSYREMMLRGYFNVLAKQFFLSTSTGDDLDNYALFYGVTRLKGAKPYARTEFELSIESSVDMTIPKGLNLIDDSSSKVAILTQDVVIKSGELKAIGVVELQLEVAKNDTKCELITTPLPFILSAKSLEAFGFGSSLEDDTAFRNRILLSLSDKSTAGAENTYKSYTFKADERIEDVAVFNGGAGVVNIYYYSLEADEKMAERIENYLNAKDVRPLTDNVIISPVIEVPYGVTAEIKINPNQDTGMILTNAVASLNSGLSTLKKIGVNITLSEINDFLRVSGVKEVIINEPIENITIENNQIGVNSENTITYTTI